MGDLVDKISSYNLFNYLFPGAVFAYLVDAWTSFELIHDNFLIAFFLYYFVGLVISRIGSLFLEPILKATKFVRFSAYSDFVEASKSDEKLSELSEANNTYRTLMSLFLVLLIVRLIDALTDGFGDTKWFHFLVVCLFFVALFAFSYRKQTAYINGRVEKSKTCQ